MRIPKKIRGQKKLSNRIESWKQESLNLDIEAIKARNYEYVKIWVQPLDNLRYHNRNYIGPKSNHRKQIIKSLIEIYDAWNSQLNKLKIPYYLKIWWYEPRITSSQVVCATGDRINYYENLFELTKCEIQTNRYPEIANKLSEFQWLMGTDEEIIENDFWPIEGYEDKSEYYKRQRQFRKLESMRVKKVENTENEEKSVTYFVPKGKIYVGARK